ncbi:MULTISPECIES: MFS transporter [Actinomadura]|uniref:MFS transporter n=1 Tax=Actinomadura yumaensis TaxID=111807 RepID=A0ABW2CJA6_9ACTN|nr:MFS transporter [Actinomadura sp. J1-007]MWK39832.1 MFS transporter [Actinomadura sp. J1-007]
MSGTERRRRLALLVSAAGAMLVALDGTVLMVAQPSVREDLGASVAQMQWTSTGYLLAVAALLVIAGRLGDRYGHRRLLVCGLAGFAASSAGIAFAPGIGWVIALRVVQGVFGALLQPATLALLRLAYPADRLGSAVAVRTSAIGVAGAAGPLLGGVLVAQSGWRGVFAINVPVALAIAAVAVAVRVPAPARRAAQRLNATGAVLVAAVLAIGVHTLVGVPAHGWTGRPTLAGLAFTAGGAAFLIVHERRAAHPIVPPAVARPAPVTAAMAILLVTTGGMFGALFVVSFLLQDALGLGPLAAALHVLPLTVFMVLGAPATGMALRRYGPRRTAATGSVLVVLGILGMCGLPSADASAGVPTAVWGATSAAFALLGVGFAAVMVTATGTVVGDAPAGYAGAVGGLKQTAVNIGPTLGIAVAASLMQTAGAGPLGTLSASVHASRSALLALAVLAALGLLPALLLSARPSPTARRPEPAASTPLGEAPGRRPAP